MGKQRRQRRRLHAPAVGSATFTKQTEQPAELSAEGKPLLAHLSENSANNIFTGLKIDIGSINKNLADDVRSMKSYKSAKSELGKESTMSKKDKLKLRREMFLKKLDLVNEVKKQNSLRTKSAIIGDTNPLHDALPSLESLLKERGNVSGIGEKKKAKGIEKSKKQKKKFLQGIHIYKQILKNKQFTKDPFGAISQHIQAVVEYEKK